jgi:hypothetical protein
VAKAGFKWRKWNNILHRDIGYLAVGMTLIYGLSGIALNHLADWNPSYDVTRTELQWPQPLPGAPISKEMALSFLEQCGEEKNYKKHYYPEPDHLRIFIKSGAVDVDMTTGHGVLERLSRRPIFFEVNYLHYNPKRLWTWFSDVYCVALMLLAITGLFVLKGRKGITGRGAWLTSLGIAMPIAFLIAYL